MRDPWKYRTVPVTLGSSGMIRQKAAPDLTELQDVGSQGWEACGWIPVPPGVEAQNGTLGWVLLKRQG